MAGLSILVLVEMSGLFRTLTATVPVEAATLGLLGAYLLHTIILIVARRFR